MCFFVQENSLHLCPMQCQCSVLTDFIKMVISSPMLVVYPLGVPGL